MENQNFQEVFAAVNNRLADSLFRRTEDPAMRKAVCSWLATSLLGGGMLVGGTEEMVDIICGWHAFDDDEFESKLVAPLFDDFLDERQPTLNEAMSIMADAKEEVIDDEGNKIVNLSFPFTAAENQ